SIEGPLWMRDGSPFAKLFADKGADVQQIAFFGSTALIADGSDQPRVQVSNPDGRLSRAIPLFLAEQVHIGTNVAGFALIPWVQHAGFALFGRPYEDRELCQIVQKNSASFSYVFAVILDTTKLPWEVRVRLLRTSDSSRINEFSVPCDASN